MQPSRCLVRPHPYSVRATTTASHPQLRDLVVHTPEAGNTVALVCYDSVCSVDLYAARPPEYTPLQFSPSTISTGCGLIAVGGQSSELALLSATPGQDWCHQYLPATSAASSTGVRTLHSGSINNSIHIAPSPHSPATPRLLVSSNDEAIRVFDVAGRPPDFRAANRRRERQRRVDGSVVDRSSAAERGYCVNDALFDGDDQGDGGSPVEECPSFDKGGECFLAPVPSADIRLHTAVNSCSVSPDSKWLVAVGDTNEVFLYDTRAAGYELAHVFTASDDASFSTDWNEDNVTFAVASQDGFVHVYDLRALPSSSRPASPTLRGAHSAPRKVAELRTTQAGPAGAARKVRFSPGGKRVDAGLMAFTEHRNRVHVVDARTFETFQILDVPSAASSSSPPPLRPRPQPALPPSPPLAPPRSMARARPSPPPRAPSGTRTPRDERERDALEREMRDRTERRFALEEARARAWRLRGVVAAGATGEGDRGEDERISEDGDEVAREDEEEERDSNDDDDDEDDGSAGSSVDTTRPRRFEPAYGASASSSSSSSSFPFDAFAASVIAMPHPLEADSVAPRTTLSLPAVRRNFASYMPPPAPPPALTRAGVGAAPASSSRIPAYAAPPAPLADSLLSAGRTPASFYYATYLPPPASPPAAFAPAAPRAGPLHPPGSGAGAGAGAYYPSSAYFPLDSAPGDLLGLDWDEHGERLLVATGERVWEWEVDREARRGSAVWGVI
ncbi:hypothetical protein JCM3770_003417 [Rhodotorula araucariae]